MIEILMYYWRDARYHMADNRQMLIDTGLVVPMTVRLKRWVQRMTGAGQHKKRAARWCG